MKIITSSSSASSDEAVQADLSESLQALVVKPAQLLLCYYNIELDQAALANSLQPYAEHIMGASSCGGALCVNHQGAQAQAKAVVFALSDSAGDYGVGHAAIAQDPFNAGVNAIEQALALAHRSNECPELIWCVLPPGCEEAVMDGIASVVGEHVPITGGSSADNDVAGAWSQLVGDKIVSDSVVVAAIFPSTEIAHCFSSGYLPSEHKGLVTACEQRQLKSIDHLPAAQVYNRWSQGTITDQLSGGSVLAATTLNPLARVVATVDGVEQYVLTHPESINQAGDLMLFSQLEVGDELVMMQGSSLSLVERAAAVLETAVQLLPANTRVSGALMIYCAGCMLTVGDQIQQVANSLLDQRFGFPVVGTYTFGEQGCFLDGQSRHGNLMISAVVFADA